MCFESILSIYLCKDRSTLTCPKWFSALISLTSSRLTNLPSRSSDLTCRPNAVSNLYVSSATLPHEEWQVSNSPTPINEESKEPNTFEKFFRTHFAPSNSRLSLRPCLGGQWRLLQPCGDHVAFQPFCNLQAYDFVSLINETHSYST